MSIFACVSMRTTGIITTVILAHLQSFAKVNGLPIELDCEVLKDQKHTLFFISDTAIRSARKVTVDVKSGLINPIQVLSCSCPNDKKKKAFGDTDVVTLDQNATRYESWNSSSVLHIHSCVDLQVSFIMSPSGTSNFASRLSGAILIFENIVKLQLITFTVGEVLQSVDNQLPITYSSIYFRYVTFNVPPTLKFRDKVEVLFQGVRIMPSQKLAIDVTNKDSNLDPILRIVENQFDRPTSVKSGIDSTSSTFEMKVKNEQLSSPVGSSCEFDYKGTIIIQNNDFGVLVKNAIMVSGASKVIMDRNGIAMHEKDAIVLENVKTLNVTRNRFGFAFDVPPLQLIYLKKMNSNACTRDDLPLHSINSIVVTQNSFSSTIQSTSPSSVASTSSSSTLPVSSGDLVGLTTDGYSRGSLLSNPDVIHVDLANNTMRRLCMCTSGSFEDRFALDLANDSDEISLVKKIVLQAKCDVLSGNGVITGLRSKICEGDIPETRRERYKKRKRDINKRWTAYLILSVISAVILTAAITTAIIKYCCMAGGSSGMGRGMGRRKGQNGDEEDGDNSGSTFGFANDDHRSESGGSGDS